MTDLYSPDLFSFYRNNDLVFNYGRPVLVRQAIMFYSCDFFLLFFFSALVLETRNRSFVKLHHMMCSWCNFYALSGHVPSPAHFYKVGQKLRILGYFLPIGATFSTVTLQQLNRLSKGKWR